VCGSVSCTPVVTANRTLLLLLLTPRCDRPVSHTTGALAQGLYSSVPTPHTPLLPHTTKQTRLQASSLRALIAPTSQHTHPHSQQRLSFRCRSPMDSIPSTLATMASIDDFVRAKVSRQLGRGQPQLWLPSKQDVVAGWAGEGEQGISGSPARFTRVRKCTFTASASASRPAQPAAPSSQCCSRSVDGRRCTRDSTALAACPARPCRTRRPIRTCSSCCRATRVR
jgi:hypothetical protein